MSDIALPFAETKSLQNHARLGLLSILVVLGGLTYWSAVTPLSGAVVAGGSIVVDGGSRRVQHQEGGIVDQILVQNEDHVVAGQVLARLDGTSIKANLAVIQSQLVDAYVREARLIAERDGGPLLWPAELDSLPNAEHSRDLFAAEDRLRQTRATSLINQRGQLTEQVTQLAEQVRGLEGQQASINGELAIVTSDSAKTGSLVSKGLTEGTRLSAINRDLAKLQGDAAQTVGQIAGARAAIAERKLQISQLDDTLQNEVLGDLQKVRQSLAELQQQQIAAQDRLARLEIKAPISGVVHESTVHTIGGVVAPGDTLMQIVPQEELNLVDIRVSPLDIDKLSLGQEAGLRFSSFDARTTPELNASITSISPDLSRDAQSGAQFYLVRASISEAELKRFPEDLKLIPGMPAQAFFKTGDRTVLSYLMKPLAEQMSLAFRED